MTARAVKGRPDRETMLKLAEALFAEQGFGACSLRDVIAAMGCSTTAFYARFESKEQVFEELVAGLVDDLQVEVGRTLAGVRNVDEGFARGVEALAAVLGARRGLVALALSEGAALAPIRDVLNRSFDGLAALAAAQFQLLGADAPTDRAWALVGSVHLHVMRWAVFEDLTDDELLAVVVSTGRALLP